MASRRGWIVILGPPLILAAVFGTSHAWLRAAVARNPQAGLPIAACAGPAADPGPADPGPAGAGPGSGVAAGTWWSRYPRLDDAGALAGWGLSVGRPGTTSLRLDLPAAAMVSGPDRGRVIAATDDGITSALRVFDATTRCQRVLPLDGVIARRAILVPGRAAALVHLLDRATRRDLGVWRVPLDGSPRSQVLAPITANDLRTAGIERVWVTDLVLASDAGALAVQSCDPDTCVTRVLDLRRGSVTLITGSQGGLVGLDADHLVAHARCTGEPCGVVAWSLDTLRPATLVPDAYGAALTDEGHLIAGVQGDGESLDAVAIDLRDGVRRVIGRLEPGVEPGDGRGDTGIETQPGEIVLLRSDGTATTLAIDPPSAGVTEVLP